MRIEDMVQYLPDDWSPVDLSKKYELIPIPTYTVEYAKLASKYQVFDCEPVFRLQNPLLFTKFHMKCLEYESRGDYEIATLYHDTVQSNVDSIATYNMDWRYGERFRYGPGVYFSTSSFRAHKRSNPELGPHRAMFLANVIMGKHQVARPGDVLPDLGYDTLISNDGQTIVKYNDNEYYPSYVMFYDLY